MKAVVWVVVLSTGPSPSGGQMTENNRQTVSPFRTFYICSRRNQFQQVRTVLLMLVVGSPLARVTIFLPAIGLLMFG